MRVKETTQWGISFTQLKPYVINETVIKIYNEIALFSLFSVSQIYFELESISNNRSSINRGFTVYCNVTVSSP